MTFYNYKPNNKRTSTAKAQKDIYHLGIIQKPKALLSTTKSEETKQAFHNKVLNCIKIYNFNSNDNAEEKQQKTQYLEDIADYITNNQIAINEESVDILMEMISTNVFRAFKFTVIQKPPQQNGMDFDDEETVVDNGWVHLQYVYEIFLKLLLLPWFNGKYAEKYFSSLFLKQLTNNFSSEDTRERDFLKTILHRLYGKFMVVRPIIKSHLQNIFLMYTYESTENYPGIGDLLEVYQSIITGFSLPLKAEHIHFLEKVLIPLSKHKNLMDFQQQLSKCIRLYAEKDHQLFEKILSIFCKYWPLTNSIKEIGFLSCIEECVEAVDKGTICKCSVKFFNLIRKCLESYHSQVVDKTLSMLMNENLSMCIPSCKSIISTCIAPALINVSTAHWNVYAILYRNIQNQSVLVIKRLMTLDASLIQVFAKMKPKQ